MILETSISRWDCQSNYVTRSPSLHTMILQTSRDCKSLNITDLHGSQPRMRTELLRQKSFATRRCRLCCETRFLSEIKVDLKLRLTKLTSWPSCQHNDNVKPGLLILAIPGPFYWERNHHFFAAQVSIDSPIPYRYCVYHGKKKKKQS